MISGESRAHASRRKRMYELGAERAGVPAELCVFVDDLPFNLTPAEELGMATVHHTSAETTIPRARSSCWASAASSGLSTAQRPLRQSRLPRPYSSLKTRDEHACGAALCRGTCAARASARASA